MFATSSFTSFVNFKTRFIVTREPKQIEPKLAVVGFCGLLSLVAGSRGTKNDAVLIKKQGDNICANAIRLA